MVWLEAASQEAVGGWVNGMPTALHRLANHVPAYGNAKMDAVSIRNGEQSLVSVGKSFWHKVSVLPA